MISGDIITVSNSALTLILSASVPAILAAAVGGLAISLLQALTQVQDQAMPTAVKFFAVIAVLFFTYLSTANEFMSFGDLIFDKIAQI
jgi:type III secretion protein S